MIRSAWDFRPILLLIATIVLLGFAAGCGPTQWSPTLLESQPPPPPSTHSPFLKAHLHSGELVVFESWTVPREGDRTLNGRGTRYGVDRDFASSGTVALPLDSVALLESNQREMVGTLAFAGLTSFTIASAVVTLACLADPKSCFGSCPTFYVEDGASDHLVAEGFSSSVARVFEDHDVDALPSVDAGSGGYSLLMRNEAPETHAVRWLHLLAVPRPPGGSVYATSDGRFLQGSVPEEPGGCLSEALDEGRDCLDLLRAPDGLEYFVPADSTDLGTREVVELDFSVPEPARSLGLLLRGRASLMSTFLFYQTLAYVGTEAGLWLAALERGDADLARRVMGLPQAIGDVEVQVRRGGKWEEVGVFGEAGPIASDEQVIPLPDALSGPLKIRLRMARGAWRIDQVGLVELGAEVRPTVLHPSQVETVSGGVPGDVALERLLDPERYLVTQQGDAFRVHFPLPAAHPDLALFLDSRGYYYEWMREDWLRETNPAMAALILSDPEEALRRMAPDFKAREPHMEETFWSSRFRRNQP